VKRGRKPTYFVAVDGLAVTGFMPRRRAAATARSSAAAWRVVEVLQETRAGVRQMGMIRGRRLWWFDPTRPSRVMAPGREPALA
jgi:hypothetical protein